MRTHSPTPLKRSCSKGAQYSKENFTLKLTYTASNIQLTDIPLVLTWGVADEKKKSNRDFGDIVTNLVLIHTRGSPFLFSLPPFSESIAVITKTKS